MSDGRLDSIPAQWVSLGTVGVVLFVLVLSSPVLGAVDLTPETRDRIGEGTANATLVSDPADGLRIDRGRFGTGVFYLRVPPAVVDVQSVTGRSRLVYQLRIPALDFQRTATTPLTEPGRARLRMEPRAFTLATVNGSSYRAVLVVRVQSFETNRVIARRTVTIPVTNSTTWGTF